MEQVHHRLRLPPNTELATSAIRSGRRSRCAHNAGTINPPAAKKHGYWTNAEMPADPEGWFKNAKRNEGSWWPEWAVWLKERSGGEVAARTVGDGPLPVLEAAPGSYVKVRH